MGVLSDLDDDPRSVVIFDPHMFLVLEAFSSCLCGGMDPPFVGGVELLNDVVVNEDGNCLFTCRSCGEGPHGGSLSFCFVLGGGMVRGCLGHSLLGRGSECEAGPGR